MNRVLIALGVSDPMGNKAQRLPLQQIRFLRFTLDAEQQKVALPEKHTSLEEAVDNLLLKITISTVRQ